jgi:DNA ligase-4
MRALSYDFALLQGLHPPSLFLQTPLLAELFGAGFTKAPHSRVSHLSLFDPIFRKQSHVSGL